MVAFDIPAAASVNTRAAAPACHRFVTMEWAVSAGLPAALATSIYDQDGGAQRAEDDERTHVQGRFSGQRRPGEFLDLLLLYEAAGLGVRCFRDGLSFCGLLVWMMWKTGIRS